MAILDETRMTLAEVAAFCRLEIQAVRKWVRKGLRGVKLEAVQVGRTFFTSREALDRFIAATNPDQGA
jgi:hypothetical protein